MRRGSLYRGESPDGCRRCPRAEACFRELIGLLPDFAEAHAKLGLLLDQEGLPAEAEQHYRQSIALNPDKGRPI